MRLRLLPALLGLCALAACATRYVPPANPAYTRDLARPGARLDVTAAATLISDYRESQGLPALTLDPTLMRMAQMQAAAMVAHDNLDHNVIAPFAVRLKSAGYDAERAAEDIGAGYRTLGAVFAGWHDSSEHNANMLLPGATRMGIAAVYAPKSKYKIYWSLEVAKPDKSHG